MKRMSGVAVTQSGCGSSRKNLYQPMAPKTITKSKSTSNASFQPYRFFCPSAIISPFVTR